MKKILVNSLLLPALLFSTVALAQNPQQAINAEMEKAMKNMTPEQRKQMEKMMPAIMPAMLDNANEYRYPEFTSNSQLLYKKDMARINAIPKKKLMQVDIAAYTNNLFTKMMAKGDAAEIAIIKMVIAKGNDAAHFENAAILCMLQGHAQAAMGLSMKAVIAEPTNANWQNNMASLLTQYGYAENAIPVLQKLRSEIADNSTVLNNLGQAWFSLGTLDSAKELMHAATKINPDNTDALITAGVIDETEGNTKGAIEKYMQAMAQSPDGFTETLLKNNTGLDWQNILCYNDLIENITVHEYFPKDWIKIPELSNNVSGFEKDVAIKNGYAKMFQAFNKDLQFRIDQSQAEVKNLTKQGHEGFAMDMITAGAKHGHSFISTPARIIISLITVKLQQLSQEYEGVRKEIKDNVEQRRKEKDNGSDKDNCAATDRRNNKFLAEANSPVFNRNIFELFIENYRKWLNAYCTWTWYLTGNIKNVSMVYCLNFTKFYAGLYQDAIEMQQTAFPCGVEGLKSDGETKPNSPLIPDFKCPLVVAVPSGFDWHALENTLKNFDENSLGIKKLAAAPVPNMSIAYGAGGKNIAQPGQGPFTKTANGDILPQYGGAATPKSSGKISEGEVNSFELRKLGKMVRDFNKKSIQEMMTSSCEELQKLTPEQKKKLWEEKKRKAAEEARKKAINELDEEDDKTTDERTIKTLSEEIQKMYEEMSGNKFYPVPTLSSSVQSPGTFTPQQNLFK